jgi:hypothetical protein
MFDQNFLFMAFLMLCFAGLATMFYFMMRNIDDLTRMIKEDRNQMQTNLRALESSINHLADLLSRMSAAEHLPRGAAAERYEAARRTPSRAEAMGATAAMASASHAQGNVSSGAMDLRTAMLSPSGMPASPPPGNQGRRTSVGNGAASSYGALCYDEPEQVYDSVAAAGVAIAASGRQSASSAAALPNLSMDGGLPTRRR